MMHGQCNCGAVAFAIDADITDVYVCHCSICRKLTGANGIPVVLVDRGAFRWLRGEEDISTWKKPDADWRSWFCRTCGSTLPGSNDETRMFVPAGLLPDDAGVLKVAHHIWVGSKAGWDEIGDDGQQHQAAFGA